MKMSAEKENMEKKKDAGVVIDGTDMVLGRLGSEVCKRLLLGEKISLVNCKDVVLLGKKQYLVERYKNKVSNKVIKKGPYYHRSPADLVKRSFRNMLPYKNLRGKEALLRLKCYNSTPSTLLSVGKEQSEKAKLDHQSSFYYTKVEEISKALGYFKE